jgi:hypothetical protein
MDIDEVNRECIDLTDLAWDRYKWWELMNMVMNQWVP